MSRLRPGDTGVDGKDIITDAVLDGLIFNRKWFAWLDRFVDQDLRRRQKVGQLVFYVPLVASVVMMQLFGVLDSDQLVGQWRKD